MTLRSTATLPHRSVASSFLTRMESRKRRGLMGALRASGALAGILLGSAVGAAFAAQQYMFLNIFSVHLSISRQFKGAIVAAVTY
jgi:hypothetical protein